MEVKYDLRIVRTYKLLTEAFLQLLGEKHLEDITIGELCERAMIRRTTFYKHFADKFEFLRFFIWQIQESFSEAYKKIHENDQGLVSFYTDIIRYILDFIKEYEQIVHMVSESNMLYIIIDIFSEHITTKIIEEINTKINDGTKSPAQPEIIASFFAGAIMQTIKWWFMHKKQPSEDKLIRDIENIVAVWQ